MSQAQQPDPPEDHAAKAAGKKIEIENSHLILLKWNICMNVICKELKKLASYLSVEDFH